MDDIADQGLADEATRTRWRMILDSSLQDISDGDVLIGFAAPENKTLLLHNGAVIATIDEQAFADAFFSIWLGDHADEDLRAELLGQAP